MGLQRECRKQTLVLSNHPGEQASSSNYLEETMEASKITNLVYRPAALIDSGDLTCAAALFRQAQIQLSDNASWIDHQDLLSVWQIQFPATEDGSPGTRHLITNPIIEIDAEQGTATCHSNYCIMQLGGPQPLQLSESGQTLDRLVRQDGEWRFDSRQYLNVRLAETKSPTNKSSAVARNETTNSEIKAKIITAAQQIFSTIGYSEAGIRKIADAVGVAPTILFRHFGTKANLFEAALTDALGTPTPPDDRENFGQYVADMLADPSQPNCPHAMSVLATGNEEAREIAIRVLKERTITPMMEWLGPPNAESRTREIIALCAGFALYTMQLNTTDNKAVDPHMVEWLARSIQAAVDET